MKDEWRICIEETENYLRKHGIIVLVNQKGQKLFMRPKSHENGYVELKPLTVKELKDLSIEVQESCINSYFDIEVQESDQRTPAQIATDEAYAKALQKSQKIPLNSVSDAEKMKEIAEKAKEILARKDASPEDLKAENEDLRLKLEIIASKELDRRCQILGIPENSDLRAKIRENPSILQGYEQRIKEEMLSGGQIPEGSAPLNSAQVYGKIPEQSFNSEKEMIDYLRKNKTPENEAILRKLFEKAVQGMVERRSWEIPFENANPKSKSESDSNVKAVEVNINAPKDPNQESEIEKWTKKKKRIE
jgi:hypothetical protein